MAQTGFTPIQIYSSSTPTNAPSAGNLTNDTKGSELAINIADKNLFFKDSTGVVNTVPIRQSSTSSNGWLSSTDWNTFNNKANAFTYTANYIPYGQGTATPTQSAGLQYNGTTFSTTGISTTNNLAFTGTGNRITGDFSNGTALNRVAFQTSTTNSGTTLEVLPNGTSSTSALILETSSSDPANAAYGRFLAASTDVRVESGIRGTGTFLPLTMFAGGSERARIFASGGVSIGNTTDPGAGALITNANAIIASSNPNGQIVKGRQNYYQIRDARTVSSGTVNFMSIDIGASTYAAIAVRIMSRTFAPGVNFFARAEEIYIKRASSGGLTVTSKLSEGDTTNDTVSYSVSGNIVYLTYTYVAVSPQNNSAYVEIIGMCGTTAESAFTVSIL